MSENHTEMTLEALRSVPLFASLDDKAATDLRSLLKTRTIPRKTKLFRKGELGDSMYLIESGRICISIKDEEGNDVTLAELARPEFLSFIRSNPDVALVMLSAVTHRLRRTDELLRSRVSRNVNDEEEARMTMADRA